jgi:CRISPR-associated protein Cas1
VHTGHVRSFVFDVADLYKAEYAIPCAFEIAAGTYLDIGAETRRAMRDRFHDGSLLERCVRDIRHLLLPDDATPSSASDTDADVVQLWDGGERVVAGGTSYPEPDW